MNENLLNESVIREDIKKCLKESMDQEERLETNLEKFFNCAGDQKKIHKFVHKLPKEDLDDLKDAIRGHIDELRSEHEYDDADELEELYSQICNCEDGICDCENK